jgi:hypothetical protein
MENKQPEYFETSIKSYLSRLKGFPHRMRVYRRERLGKLALANMATAQPPVHDQMKGYIVHSTHQAPDQYVHIKHALCIVLSPAAMLSLQTIKRL